MAGHRRKRRRKRRTKATKIKKLTEHFKAVKNNQRRKKVQQQTTEDTNVDNINNDSVNVKNQSRKLRAQTIADAFRLSARNKRTKTKPQKRQKIKTPEAVTESDDDSDNPDLDLLKNFDLNWEYGPCIGITRLERWERAKKFQLNPPVAIKRIILEHGDKEKYTQCIWYTYKGL